jgi:hypothetical protein
MRMDFLKYFSYYCQKIMISPCYFGPPVLGDPVYRVMQLMLLRLVVTELLEGFKRMIEKEQPHTATIDF